MSVLPIKASVALAMTGGYILANESKADPGYQAAFTAYNRKLWPYAESIRKLPPGFSKLAYPSSESGVYLLNKAAGVVVSNVFQTVAGCLKVMCMRAGVTSLYPSTIGHKELGRCTLLNS